MDSISTTVVSAVAGLSIGGGLLPATDAPSQGERLDAVLPHVPESVRVTVEGLLLHLEGTYGHLAWTLDQVADPEGPTR